MINAIIRNKKSLKLMSWLIIRKKFNIDNKQLISKKLFKDNDLSLLENILLKDYKLKNGHGQSDNDKLIQEFLFHVAKCVKEEEKLRFMIVVAVYFQISSTSTVLNLSYCMMQLSYHVKI